MNFPDNIERIMEKYGVRNYSVQKLRSVYKIKSQNKILILKKFNSKNKILNTKTIIEYLKNNNFKYLQNIVYDLENRFFVCVDEKFYMCFEWVDGREINVKNKYETKKCIQAIFSYHESVKNLDYSFMNLKDGSDWIKKFENDILNLYKIRDKIFRKNYFDLVDRFYFENISRAISNIERLKKHINVEEFYNFINENKIVCHNSLYYQNFIFCSGKIYLIDFGGICVNSRVYDIARFCRRIFYKNNFNSKILSKLYKTCDDYYSFNRIEKLLFYIYVRYPYKFVKFANKIYMKNKFLDQNRLIKKLEKYGKYELNVFEN